MGRVGRREAVVGLAPLAMVRPKEILPVLGFFIVASVSVRTLFNANKRAYFKERREQNEV